MSKISELEKEILALSAAERERLAAVAWESLVADPNTAGNPAIDPEGVKVATDRDTEIESGKASTIGHAEFLRRTGGKPE